MSRKRLQQGGYANWAAPPKGAKCVDCGRPAIESDHRDYNRPRDVDFVCRRCNVRRGPAVPRIDPKIRWKYKLKWVLRKPLPTDVAKRTRKEWLKAQAYRKAMKEARSA